MNYKEKLIEACGEDLIVIESYDQDKKEVYHLALTMDGMEVLEVTPLSSHFIVQLGRSLDHQVEKIKAARRAKTTIESMRKAEIQMERVKEQAARSINGMAAAMKTAQESMSI